MPDTLTRRGPVGYGRESIVGPTLVGGRRSRSSRYAGGLRVYAARVEQTATVPTVRRIVNLASWAGRIALAAAVFFLSNLSPPMPALLNPLPRPPGATVSETITSDGSVIVTTHADPLASLAVVLIAAGCGLVVVLARWRRWPLYTVALIAWLLYGMWPAVPVASYHAATRLRRAEVTAFAVAAGTAVALPGLTRATVGGGTLTAENAIYAGLALALLVGLPLLLGLLVTARREVRGGARAQAQAREREQAARLDQARAQERARIAREMHDVLAHRVSLMVLHAGAVEVGAPDQPTADSAALIRTIGREALTDLRHVLGVLRSPEARLDPQPGLADLDQLLEQSRLAGVPVVRRDDGQARPIPETVQRAAYRVVQEALTNVHKHAGDAATQVMIRYQPQAIEVKVRNAPAGPVQGAPAGDPSGLPGSGLGLAGLRERVELLGGRLDAGPCPDGGFVVLAWLPVESA
jgi:signal transduction histidine kinase